MAKTAEDPILLLKRSAKHWLALKSAGIEDPMEYLRFQGAYGKAGVHVLLRYKMDGHELLEKLGRPAGRVAAKAIDRYGSSAFEAISDHGKRAVISIWRHGPGMTLKTIRAAESEGRDVQRALKELNLGRRRRF